MRSSTPPPLPARGEPEVIAQIRDGGPALVALSGGVDSSLVAALAAEALGAQICAVTLAGPAVARTEVERARGVAAFLGIRHAILSIDPVADDRYRSNPSDRCYFCRHLETRALRSYGVPRGLDQFLDGIHLDDLSEDRPGLKAMDEAGFFHPLAWAGWTKADVRSAARSRSLPNWDQPSDACLASRIAHGEPISLELLAQVEAAEEVVRSHGFRRVRVRVRGRSARIEVDPEEVARLRTEPLASTVERAVRSLGFDPVTIDPRGYGYARVASARGP